MKQKNILLLLAIIILLFSCIENKPFTLNSFTKIKTIRHEKILLAEGSYFSRAMDLYLINDKILVYDVDEIYFFSLFDLKRRSIIQKAGKRGQGPNEIITSPHSITKINDNKWQFYDTNKHRIFNIILNDSDSIIINENSHFKTEESIYNILPIANGNFITVGRYESGKYLLLTQNGKELSYFFNYPKLTNESFFTNRHKAMAFQGSFDKRPDGKRFVFAAKSSEIVEIIELNNENQLKKIFEWHGEMGTYTPGGDGKNSCSAGISQKSKSTFRRVCSTQNYIYLLYSGHFFYENYAKVVNGRTIYVMNWDGEPVMRYNLDIDVKCIAVSADDKTLYAIAEQDDTNLVKFKLNH
jgi:hypothetical protein